MKKCPKCGNINENDNAKFCKKCGAKQPEIVAKEKEPTEIKPSPDEGILLKGTTKRQIADDEEQKISPILTGKTVMTNSSTSSIVSTEENGLLWAVKTCFKKYATFNGRASRREYWFFCLFNILMSSILFGTALIINREDISLIFLGLTLVYSLVIFLPALAVTVRRLHDIGKSGWLYCIIFIPYIGTFILLYFLCKKSNLNANIYG